MIITVTRIVIDGEKRIEKTATAQIDRPCHVLPEIPPLGHAAVFYPSDPITDTARSLFDSLDTSEIRLPPSEIK